MCCTHFEHNISAVTDYLNADNLSASVTIADIARYSSILDTSTYDVIVVPAIWGTLFLAGIAGNSLVVYVMLRFADVNTTNCYIVNLAVTDLLFTVIVIPFTMMHYVMPSWIFGRYMCKFHMYMIYVSILGNASDIYNVLPSYIT